MLIGATSGAAAANWAQVIIAVTGFGVAMIGVHRWMKKNVSEPIKAVPIMRATMAKWEVKNASVSADVRAIKDMATAAAELAGDTKVTLDERAVLFDQIRENLGALQSDVTTLKWEYRPNGGTSLRDSNDRTEALSRETAANVAELSKVMATHAATDEQIWGELTDKLLVLASGQELAATTAVDVAEKVKAATEQAATDLADTTRAEVNAQSDERTRVQNRDAQWDQ